jgi:uncharacterized protein involved in response to NO
MADFGQHQRHCIWIPMATTPIIDTVTAIPRYRPHSGPAILSAGFRPFFLLAALWAAIAIPLWLCVFAGRADLPSLLAPSVWHVHEMIYGFGAATVAGFLLTAIPNWTGRMPLQGGPLALLVLLWAAGRGAVLLSEWIGAPAAMALDLAFPAAFFGVVAREILAGRNWRNLPMLVALALLFAGNLLVHLDAIGVAVTAAAGNRLGIATLLLLIGLVGGRIIPSFTGNWLAKQRPDVAPPAAFNAFDRAALVLTALALLVWVIVPDVVAASWLEMAAGAAVALRLARWRGHAVWSEPLLWILHLGYGWLAAGLLLLGLNGILDVLPSTAALHALTAGAIGTMTLAVMTRASLGHTGQALTASPGTTAIYVLVTLAAFVRVLAGTASSAYEPLLMIAGAAWTAAFGLFVVLYVGPLSRPRTRG